MPATLTSAAEEHAQALREELLKSTELAAKNIVGQTRAEGERRIEVAGRRAQAIAETVSAIEQAEQALGERAKAFAEASKALRAELECVRRGALAGRGAPATSAAATSRTCVWSRPGRRAEAPEAPVGIGQVLFTSEPDPVEDADVEAETEAESPEDELDEERRRGRTGLRRGRRASDAGSDPAVLPRGRGGRDRARRAPRAPGRREPARLVSRFFSRRHDPLARRRQRPREAPSERSSAAAVAIASTRTSAARSSGSAEPRRCSTSCC